MRLAMNMTVFLVIMAAFGAVRSPWAVRLPARGGADRAGLRDAARSVRHDPAKSDQAFNDDLPLRHDPAVPVLRHVLPGHASCPPGSGRSPTSTPLWHGVDLVPGAEPSARATVRSGTRVHCRLPGSAVAVGGLFAGRSGATGSRLVSEPAVWHRDNAELPHPAAALAPARPCCWPPRRFRRPGQPAPDRAACPRLPAYLG